jgi:hypothetical protein
VLGFSILVLLAILIQGCSASTPGDATRATLTAMSRVISGTATAEKAQPSSLGDLAAAQDEATQQSQKISVTQTAQLANRDTTKFATATITAPIVAELPLYGLNASSGELGWIHNPLTLDISGWNQMDYGNDFPNITAKDFVLAADVTWNTQYGDSGCGFMFRSNGNQQKPDLYMVIATRFTSGRVIFTALTDGELANIHDFYPKTEDRAFQWENDTTNRIAIVARGNLIEIYTNRVKIGEVDTSQPPSPIVLPAKPTPPLDQSDVAAQNIYIAQLEEYEQITQQAQKNFEIAYANYLKRQAIFTDGFLSMLAATQSGRTVGTFNNAWLWLLES